MDDKEFARFRKKLGKTQKQMAQLLCVHQGCTQLRAGLAIHTCTRGEADVVPNLQ